MRISDWSSDVCSSDLLFICDRATDMIISGGVNIYPAEIEAALARVPGVRDCAVFGIPDDEYGESVMAVVQPIEGQQLTPASLADALRRDIASYKSSEEHTSELQSLMRNSYAVFCL